MEEFKPDFDQGLAGQLKEEYDYVVQRLIPELEEKCRVAEDGLKIAPPDFQQQAREKLFRVRIELAFELARVEKYKNNPRTSPHLNKEEREVIESAIRSEVLASGEKIKKPKAWLVYGLGGHEREYVFATEETSSREFLPSEISEVVEQELGKDWDVLDRGTRIEVTCKKPYGARDDEKVREAFERALNSLEQKYDFLPPQ